MVSLEIRVERNAWKYTCTRGRGLLIVRIKGRTATLFRYLFEMLDGHLRTGSFRNVLVKLTDQIGGVTPATCITFG